MGVGVLKACGYCHSSRLVAASCCSQNLGNPLAAENWGLHWYRPAGCERSPPDGFVLTGKPEVIPGQCPVGEIAFDSTQFWANDGPTGSYSASGKSQQQHPKSAIVSGALPEQRPESCTTFDKLFGSKPKVPLLSFNSPCWKSQATRPTRTIVELWKLRRLLHLYDSTF
jgi:hypothetical protein